MNLHNVRFAVATVGMWLSAYGRNGRSIGIHIWMVNEGDAPEPTFERPSWQSATYWTPPPFHWMPYNPNQVFREGYVPPICGHRSQSANPRINTIRNPEVYVDRRCPNCDRIAMERGIITVTYEQAQELSAARTTLLAEQERWREAGRPAVWPQPN